MGNKLVQTSVKTKVDPVGEGMWDGQRGTGFIGRKVG